MPRYRVIINVDSKKLKDARRFVDTNKESIEEAISAELNWLSVETGIAVESIDELGVLVEGEGLK